MNKSEIIVLCGKVGSGKTTFIKEFLKNNKYMHLSVDEWMLHVYGRDIPCEQHQFYVSKIKSKLFLESMKLLQLEVSVILDFGFWTKSERNEVRRYFKDFNLRIIYLNVEDAVLKKRIKARNENASDSTYIIDEETRLVLGSRFEEPVDELNVEEINY